MIKWIEICSEKEKKKKEIRQKMVEVSRGKEKCIFNSRQGKTKERTACSTRG